MNLLLSYFQLTKEKALITLRSKFNQEEEEKYSKEQKKCKRYF